MHDDRVDVGARARGRMRERDQHVDRDRRRRPCGGERRPQAEGGHERKREERQPCLGVGAAGGVRQSAERDEVHDRLDTRQAVQRRQAARGGERVRDQQPHRPQADEEQAAARTGRCRGPGWSTAVWPSATSGTSATRSSAIAELGARLLGAPDAAGPARRRLALTRAARAASPRPPPPHGRRRRASRRSAPGGTSPSRSRGTAGVPMAGAESPSAIRPEDLALARRQQRALVVVRSPAQLVEQPALQARLHARLPPRHRGDRVEHRLAVGVLGEVARPRPPPSPRRRAAAR